MLSDQQCALVEKALTEDVEPRKVAAYLCLHLGLSSSEASALRLRDCDLTQRRLTVCYNLARADEQESGNDCYVLERLERERVLPLPTHVLALLKEHLHLYADDNCFIVSGNSEPPKIHYLQNILFSINLKYKIAARLTVNMLRDSFISRCFAQGLDLFTVGEILGLKQLAALQRRFAGLIPYHPEQVELLAQYTPGYQPHVLPNDGPRRMNLLILGAGSQGPVVREIARELGVFDEIAFLDDDPENKLARGPLSDYTRLVNIYPAAIPSFGDPSLRSLWFERLREAGYVIPRLIHPSATVSTGSAGLGDGVVAEAKVIVGSGVTVGDNVILSAGCVLDKECIIGAHTHIGCSCVVSKGCTVAPFSRITAGTVYSTEVEK